MCVCLCVCLFIRFGGIYEMEILSKDPWVVVFENFLNDTEASAIISSVSGWEQSTDTGTVIRFYRMKTFR